MYFTPSVTSAKISFYATFAQYPLHGTRKKIYLSVINVDLLCPFRSSARNVKVKMYPFWCWY